MSNTAKIHVTKLAAAERQLRAAIRMYFAEEDELATHTVASAAYKLITDLKSKRGMEEVADHHRDFLFYMLRSYHRGDLSDSVKNDPGAMEWIRAAAARIPQITADSTPDVIVSVSVTPEEIRDYWQRRTRVANFLKHADRDHRAHLAMDEVENLELILEAYSSYIDLTAEPLIPEGIAIWIYSQVQSRHIQGVDGVYLRMAEDLMQVPPAEARACLSEYIVEMKKQMA